MSGARISPLSVFDRRILPGGGFEDVLTRVFDIELDFVRECAEYLRRPDFMALYMRDPARCERELYEALDAAYNLNWNATARKVLSARVRGNLEELFGGPEHVYAIAAEHGLLPGAGRLGMANSPVLDLHGRIAFRRIETYIDRARITAENSTVDRILRSGVLDATYGFRDTERLLAYEGGVGVPVSMDGAIDSAITDLCRRGITGSPTDNLRLEAYVRREINTTMNRSAVEMQFERAGEVGCGHIIISSHAGARPGCFPYQGGVYTLEGTYDPEYEALEDTSYGEPDGIFGINCRHFPMPWFKGLNMEYGEEERNPASLLEGPDGEEITNSQVYEADQRQRECEREIRRYERQSRMFEAGGLPAKAANAAGNARGWEARLRAHIADSNAAGIELVRQRERERVAG